MSDRTWEDIGNEIRDDYLRDGGPENVRFREVQWEVWIAEVERAAAARALEEAAEVVEIDMGRGFTGSDDHVATANAEAWLRARAAEIRAKGEQ